MVVFGHEQGALLLRERVVWEGGGGEMGWEGSRPLGVA
jgi:hypothetical protein